MPFGSASRRRKGLGYWVIVECPRFVRSSPPHSVMDWLTLRFEYPQAYASLQTAFDTCRSTTPPEFRNRRRILIPLLTTALLLGTLPAPALLKYFHLEDQFVPLVRGVRYGDLRSWRRGLGDGSREGRERTEWLRSKKLLGVLREKGVILVWRSLLRRTFVFSLPAPLSFDE